MALGVINGGFGLKLANAADGYKIAYGAAAGIMFVVYAIGKIAGHMRKSRQYKQADMQEPIEPHRRPYNNEEQDHWKRYQHQSQTAQTQNVQPYEGHQYRGARYDTNRYA